MVQEMQEKDIDPVSSPLVVICLNKYKLQLGETQYGEAARLWATDLGFGFV